MWSRHLLTNSCFRLTNLCSIFSMTESHIETDLEAAPSLRPKYFLRREETLHSRVLDRCWWTLPIGTVSDLLRFTFRSDASSKQSKSALKACICFCFALQNNNVTSANNKWHVQSTPRGITHQEANHITIVNQSRDWSYFFKSDISWKCTSFSN